MNVTASQVKNKQKYHLEKLYHENHRMQASEEEKFSSRQTIEK